MKKSNEKKAYSKPDVKALGSLEDLTHGQGWLGSDDQWWGFSWGTDPVSS